MQEILHAKLGQIVNNLASLGNQFPELKPICSKMEDNLHRFDKNLLDFNTLKSNCTYDFNQYKQPSPEHIEVKKLVLDTFLQFCHLYDNIKKVSSGQKTLAHNQQAFTFFKKPETQQDIIKRLDELLAQINTHLRKSPRKQSK